VSTERGENLDAILRQSAFPFDSDVSSGSGGRSPLLKGLACRVLEPSGFRPRLHPALGYASEGGDARDQPRPSDPAAVDVGEPRQLTLNLNPGDNCFVVCGGAPCPTIVRAEFVQERCRGARTKEVSPIFVHSRVLAPPRRSL